MPDNRLLDIGLAYGRQGLQIRLPADRTTVVAPAHHAAAADVGGTLRHALRHPVAGPPLRGAVRPGQRVAVSICDVTRPQPREAMIRALIDELAGIVTQADLTVLVATGTHRGNTAAELREMLGDELAASLRIINHDARDPGMLTWCGRHGDDVPVWLNRHWMAADARITTGFVEPHFFAGFSGGPKLVAPGLAGLETTLTLHDARRIGSERATWGVCEGNPVHDDVRAIAAATGVDFALDVVLNRDQQVVAAFGGEVLAMHAAARAAVRQVSMRPVDGLFEVVVTTNAGFPLDQNLYQAVKGMSAAATVLKPGGMIVCAAECRDGFPGHGQYRELLVSQRSPRELIDAIVSSRSVIPDQWQVQVQANIQTRATVVMYTDYLSDQELAQVHLAQTRDIAATVREELERRGPGATVCVLPEGPQTIPRLAGA
jgi:nickel-dependent lactate racemase